MPTGERWPRQQHPGPGGTPERRSRRLKQEGRVAAPALHGRPCPERPVRVSNNGAERRREPRVRPAAVEEVAGSGWGGQGDAPRRSLARRSLPARRASPAPSPAPRRITDGSSNRRDYGASARVDLVLGSLLFSAASSSSSFTSCRCCLWVPGVWEYNSLPLQGDRFVTA